MLRTLFDGLESGRDGASVKFVHFFEVYDQHFMPVRDRIKRVLEVGVEGGGSLTLWSRYFPNAERIVGVDTHAACGKWTRDNIIVRIGDATDRGFMNDVARVSGPFDLVIDDGGHKAHQQRGTFDIMWPHVADGGYYVIEDTQCSYWERLGGGYREKGAIELCKDLGDCCTWWPIEKNAQLQEMRKYNGEIKAVHFHEAMVVIEKGPVVSHHLKYAFSDKKAQADWDAKNP